MTTTTYDRVDVRGVCKAIPVAIHSSPEGVYVCFDESRDRGRKFDHSIMESHGEGGNKILALESFKRTCKHRWEN